MVNSERIVTQLCRPPLRSMLYLRVFELFSAKNVEPAVALIAQHQTSERQNYLIAGERSEAFSI